VAVGVSVGSGVKVEVGSGDGVDVCVAVGVVVGVAVGLGVNVAVGSGVEVGVAVGDASAQATNVMVTASRIILAALAIVPTTGCRLFCEASGWSSTAGYGRRRERCLGWRSNDR